MRTEFRKFVAERVLPIAQGIHRKDVLIPMALVSAMAEDGRLRDHDPGRVRRARVSARSGGCGVITEELSRGYIGVGSLGTRAEIAAELIMHGGTEEQKKRWLPAIASGSVLPTAVFTEPDHGSDLAHLKTRATRVDGGGWRLDGNKTWITHAPRARP